MGAGRIFAYAPDIKKAQEAAENVLGLLASKPILDFTSNEGDMLPKGVDGLIEFQNVKFRYPTRPHVPVLQDLTITVKPGQFAALVGPSGCGKSTTIGLMERFYDPLAGTVKVDGKDISSLNLTAYRMQIGLVSQEPNLFDMSIKDNIGFGFDQPPSQELVEKAAKDANIHDVRT